MARKHKSSTPASSDSIDLTVKSLSKQEFAKRLWQLTVSKGWNQSELARQSGIGRDSISNYMRGKTVPSPSHVYKLAKALSVKPEEVLPNMLEDAMEDEVPSFEMKESHGMPGKVWVRMNRMVSMNQATRIFSILNEE